MGNTFISLLKTSVAIKDNFMGNSKILKVYIFLGTRTVFTIDSDFVLQDSFMTIAKSLKNDEVNLFPQSKLE